MGGQAATRMGGGLRMAALGAAPGIVLVLVAQFLIDGEMQLTVGAPGILIAVVGAVVGFVLGAWRSTGRRGGGAPRI